VAKAAAARKPRLSVFEIILENPVINNFISFWSVARWQPSLREDVPELVLHLEDAVADDCLHQQEVGLADPKILLPIAKVAQLALFSLAARTRRPLSRREHAVTIRETWRDLRQKVVADLFEQLVLKLVLILRTKKLLLS